MLNYKAKLITRDNLLRMVIKLFIVYPNFQNSFENRKYYIMSEYSK